MSLRAVQASELERAFSGCDRPPVWETVMGDGVPLEHEIGDGGDHRFRYGSATFHLSADARKVLWAREDASDPACQRQLLDTILFSASFANGFELLHASAVETDSGVIAFVATSGGGKSSVAAELMRRGHRLFCDDVLAIAPGPDGLLCYPGPAVMNMPGETAELGELIASFPEEQESWIAVRDAATSPRPLAAVYLVDRGCQQDAVRRLDERPLLNLLPHAISLPHDPARAASRFRLFSAIAAKTPIFRLEATSTTGVEELADLVEDELLMAVAR